MPTPATTPTPIPSHDELKALAVLDALAGVGDRITGAMTAVVDNYDVLRNSNIAILIDLHREGPSRPSELATRLGISRSRMTRLLDMMEEEQLVSRQRGLDRDGRAVTVTLTGTGQRLLGAAAQLLHRGFTDLAETLHSLAQFLDRTDDATSSLDKDQ